MVGVTAQPQCPAGDYRAYYRHYRATHRSVWGNRLRLCATAVAAAGAAAGALLAGLGAGCSLAWAGDLLLEQRQPAAFSHPLYAARAHLDLCWELLTGRDGP